MAFDDSPGYRSRIYIQAEKAQGLGTIGHGYPLGRSAPNGARYNAKVDTTFTCLVCKDTFEGREKFNDHLLSARHKLYTSFYQRVVSARTRGGRMRRGQ